RCFTDRRLIDFVNGFDLFRAADELEQVAVAAAFLAFQLLDHRRKSTSCIRVDLPEPEIPVMTDKRPTGKRTSTPFKLLARAPRIWIQSSTLRSDRRDLRVG